MKKVYIKPEILFESFTLSTNIAGDCDHKNSLQSEKAQCGLEFGGDIIYLTGIQGCLEEYDTDGAVSGICYHVPLETSQLFNS